MGKYKPVLPGNEYGKGAKGHTYSSQE